MAITLWDPLRDISTLQERVNRLLGDSVSRWTAGAEEGSYGTWMPPVEIVEKEDHLLMRAELPGIDQKDIDLQVENGVLSLRGEKRREREVKEEHIHRAERYYGSFVRTFSLPTAVDVDKIRATYRDGVLEVTLPKSETARPKRIQIGT